MLLLYLLLPVAFCFTHADLMEVIRENDQQRRNNEEWARELEAKLPPVGYVAGEPIRSRFWEHVNPNEKILFDENGLPYQLPWRFNYQPVTLGGVYKLKAIMNKHG